MGLAGEGGNTGGGVSSRRRGGRGGASLLGKGGGGGFPYPRGLGGRIGAGDPLFVSEGDDGSGGSSVQLDVLVGLGGLGGVLVPEPGIEPFLDFSKVPLIEPLAPPSEVKGEGELGALPGPGEFSSPPSCWPSFIVFTGAWALLRRPISVPTSVPPLESGGRNSNLNFLGCTKERESVW